MSDGRGLEEEPTRTSDADEDDEPRRADDEAVERAEGSIARRRPRPSSTAEAAADADDAAREAAGVARSQLGYTRFVYAAYMAGAMLVAFLVAEGRPRRLVRASRQWKPELGEPRDELVYADRRRSSASLVARLLLAQAEVAPVRRTRSPSELSKVTWPSRKEVTNSTTVVIVTRCSPPSSSR